MAGRDPALLLQRIGVQGPVLLASRLRHCEQLLSYCNATLHFVLTLSVLAVDLLAHSFNHGVC